MESEAAPRTLQEAVIRFADKQVAHDYFVSQRFPNGVACPRMGCGSADVAAIKSRNAWRCRECGRQFTVKVGTVFEDSPIGFDKWLPAMWLLSANRNGISSYEVARGLGVTQKTAWFMMHRLRLAMKADDAPEMLAGEVEIDETYVGGRIHNPRGTKSKGPFYKKTPVFGMIQRGGSVRAMVIPDNKARTIMPLVRQNVLPGSILYTDSYPAYNEASRDFVHEIINHAEAYVRGRVTTNRIENFWSCVKRTLGGTYICPRPFHLDRYLDEQVYRFNVRDEKDDVRFIGALKGADGRRVTWAELTTAHPRWRERPVKPIPARRRPPVYDDSISVY